MSGLPSSRDLGFMRRALELAQRSRPSPNPRVGAVIVKGDAIVGEGFHERPGLPHAEVNALRMAKDLCRGAELFVTLEPCCHEGRTGPCTDAVHAAGIGRVVVGMIDPDANVRGRGIARLEELGHEVSVGALGAEIGQMLEGYVMHRTFGRPLVRLKAAVSLDGAMATRSGESRWISGQESRRRAHELRAESDAVVIGVGTALADDPLLTVRDADGSTPLRVVLDSSLKTPIDGRLVASASPSLPVLLAHTSRGAHRAKAFCGRPGLETLSCGADADGRVGLVALLDLLAKRGILSVLVEGGPSVLSAFTAAAIADRFSLFVAPKLIGSGRGWVTLTDIARVDDAIAVRIETTARLGDDLLVEGSFVRGRPAVGP
jgi:diaminohydroxyphosphoribosylaminopyrimidine deaminase / 5-amino-6-(5-phosphoribosylamino)uracil reductase